MGHETALLKGDVPDVAATRVHSLSPTMRKALMVAVGSDGVQWDAEDRLGLNGEAFWKVLDALRKRELVDDDYCLTQLGSSVRRIVRRAAAGQR